ncbi:MAG: peptidoglycan DD-metalloendopeptidase family protein [Nitrospirae bacterium]|nr:peptidoglycan DD-metalloendopeptidase family protein [Nitrospirota bacterium]
MSTSANQTSRKGWLRSSLLAVAALAVGGGIWGGMFIHVRDVEATVAYPVFEVTPEPLALVTSPDEIIRGQIRKGQSVHNLLSRYGLDKGAVAQVARAAKPYLNLSQVRSGQGYCIRLDGNGRFKQLEIDLSATRLVRISVTPFGYVADKAEIRYETRQAIFSGTARSSLFASLIGKRGGAELIRRMQDVFAWRIDFNRDVRPGDTFHILADAVWRDGEFDHYGAVRYARINAGSRVLESVYFDGEYYDPDGRALRATLLPAPVDYSYVSSRFSHARRHPVYGVVRPHYGVDFVAAYGTPVRAAGDGEVIFSGWKGDNGRLVMLRHNGVYRTAYAHLSRFANGITRGTRVTQGQVIGYVGNSGASTGAHLHYGLYRDGRAIDPLSLDYTPVAEAVGLASSADFDLAWDEARLALARLEEAAATPGAATVAAVATRNKTALLPEL